MLKTGGVVYYVLCRRECRAEGYTGMQDNGYRNRDNHRLKAKLKGLPPALHRLQAPFGSVYQ